MFWKSDINPQTEPQRIVIDKGEWVDPVRGGRIVPYKIYRPDPVLVGGPYPVILWSHGLGGTRDGAGFISRFVASHGYIVIHVQHVGTDSILWEGMQGHPWDNIRKAHIPRKAVLHRYRDIPFALTQIRTMAAAGDLPKADLTHLGMSGHSFGALTTQIMAGQHIQKGTRHYHLHQPDFTAGILYSPVPGRKDPRDPGFVYGGIRIPLLHLTGTDDESPLEGFGYERRLHVHAHAGRQDQHLVILKNGDHMVFNGSRGGLKENPARNRHEDIIKILSLAWWDWHLKEDNGAHAWLTGSGAADFMGDDVVSSKPNR